MKARLFGCVIALFGLSGCDGVGASLTDGLAAFGPSRDATGEGIRTLALLGGDVRVRGPRGYCVDQRASNGRRGFAVLAGCALLARDASIMPDLPGVITVQFGADNTASVTDNEAAFAAFLKSGAGRALLAGDGDLAQVPEVATIGGAGSVLARFEDSSGPVIPGTGGPQWRGFIDIGGRLVTVSVLSLERAPLSRAQGERLLGITLAELAQVNASHAASAQVVQAAAAADG